MNEIDKMNATATAARTILREANGHQDDRLNARHFAIYPSAVQGTLTGVVMFGVAYIATVFATVPSLGLLNEQQLIRLCIIIAITCGALAMLFAMTEPLERWRKSKLRTHVDALDVIDRLLYLDYGEDEAEQPDDSAETPHITIAGQTITLEEAKQFADNAEAGDMRFTRGMFSQVSNDDYGTLVWALVAAGYAEEPTTNRYRWTPSGIAWLRRMHRFRSPPPPHPPQRSSQSDRPTTTATTNAFERGGVDSIVPEQRVMTTLETALEVVARGALQHG